jgi:hypothetical protein
MSSTKANGNKCWYTEKTLEWTLTDVALLDPAVTTVSQRHD